MPSRKSWTGVQLDFAGEEGTLSSLDTEGSCLLPAWFLSPGHVLANSLSTAAVTCLGCTVPSGWGNAGVCKPDAVCVSQGGQVCGLQRGKSETKHIISSLGSGSGGFLGQMACWEGVDS